MSEPYMSFLRLTSTDRRRGRPPRADVAATKRIEFVVTNTEREALEKMASAEGKPIATVIREAVNEFVGDFSDRQVFSSGKN